jgi:beta-glucanase (GH16 family)
VLTFYRYEGDWDGAEIPQTPFYIIINTAISWWTPPPTSAVSEVFHIIDYVRVYKNVSSSDDYDERTSTIEALPSIGDLKVVRDTVWELTWQDEFNGTALNESNWTPGQNYNDSL